ncbi:MAG TPA: hypothetical protein VEH05_02740 [Streptosporangiaceae bacterium]|nr:hypothetical protein [Streptosporangiaceae bacterium]
MSGSGASPVTQQAAPGAPLDILVCVKRVPMVGGRVVLTADGQDVDTRLSGFTVSPHEECAVEEAIRLTEHAGGTVTVLTLGPPEATEQLRDMLALGAHRGVLLETDGREWGPDATAAAIAQAIEDLQAPAFPLVLLGNEAADTGGYQVGVRLAHTLGRPCVTGIKSLELAGAGLRAGRERGAVYEFFELPLPAVVSVKEGINLPRYPSLPGRLRAKRAEITVLRPRWQPDALRKIGLRVPAGASRQAQPLGTGVDAIPELVRVLGELGVLPGAARPAVASPAVASPAGTETGQRA